MFNKIGYHQKLRFRFLSGKNLLVILAMLVAISANAQWVQMGSGIGTGQTVYALAINGNNLYAGTLDSGIYFSTNSGNNWIHSSLNNKTVTSLAVSGNNIIAGTWVNGVYFSTDNGYSWLQPSLLYQTIWSLVAIDNFIFAGTWDNGVYLTTNNGINWLHTTLSNKRVNSLIQINYKLFAGTEYDGVYSSSNFGDTWIQTSLNNIEVKSLAAQGNNIYAGTFDGVYISTNYGTSWIQTTLDNKSTYSIALSNNNIIAGTIAWGVYVSTNIGTSWIEKNEGFNVIPPTYSLLINNNYVFAGTGTRSVWRRPLSEIIGIQNISTEIPSKYSLSQNYPNPFNPTTKIQFEVPSSKFVKIVVFDILGKEVQTLVNELLQPGTYETSFKGSSLTSGVYFYRLITNEFSETKKMLLIK